MTKKPTVCIGYAGCKVNQFEKNLLAEQLADRGFRSAGAAAADIIIYNTCCVTKKAEDGCRQALRKFNRDNPAAAIIVTGCYGERAREELLRLPGVVRVVGNAEKDAIAAIIDGAEDADRGEPLGFEFRNAVRGRSRALLKVQDGCDAFCSYCIVPRVRGKPVSMPAELVISNLWRLRNEKEVVLTGVHLGKWGVDRGEKLEHLIEGIAAERYPFRIRLSSLEPPEITPALLNLLADMENYCPHFHIPLQSCCDSILAAMKRKYGRRDEEVCLRLIRRRFPDAGIGADIIAGFPGESAENFHETRLFLQDAHIDYLHVFGFSPREGTAAAAYNPRVPGDVIGDRTALVKEIDAVMRVRFASRFLNRHIRCIIDRREQGRFRAVTREYLKVYVDEPSDGEFDAQLVSSAPPCAVRPQAGGSAMVPGGK